MTDSPGGKRLAGLSCLLAGIGLVVATRAEVDQPTTHHVALLPAASTGTSTPATTGTSATTSTSTATTATQPPAAGPRTVDGDVVDTPYGPVQVAVVLNSNRIVDVKALQTPTEGSRSVRLADLATPILRQEVLTAQSAQVDTVSGATYTSEGYAQSVQYALDHR
ncbi:MAG TPA: FMN-binding protein [Pseudonocardiaceae bacterium]